MTYLSNISLILTLSLTSIAYAKFSYEIPTVYQDINKIIDNNVKLINESLTPTLKKEFCMQKDNENPYIKEYPLPEFYPSYFFRNANANGTKIAAGGKYPGQGDFVYFFDLETGESRKLETKIGSDPVFLLEHHIDGVDILSLPLSDRSMQFFTNNSIVSAKEGSKEVEKIQEDKDITGVYQSFGLVEKTDSSTKYNILSDVGFNSLSSISGIGIKDVIVTQVDQKVKIETSNPRTVCGSRLLQLPIISKDGKSLIALDYDIESGTGTTKIFDIENGACNVKHDIGFATGKGDFSYDGSKVTFHAQKEDFFDNTGAGASFFSSSNINNRFDIFVYDLDTKELSSVKESSLSTSYFPTFNKDNSLNYYHRKFTSNSMAHINTSIRRISIDHLNSNIATPEVINVGCNTDSLKSNKQMELEHLITSIHKISCFDPELKTQSTFSKILFNNFSQETCRKYIESIYPKIELARKEIEVLKPKIDKESFVNHHDIYIKELPSKEDLLSICP